MPSNSPQHDDAKPLLRVVLDDGSGLLKVVAQHVPAGARVDKQPIDILELNVAKQNQLEQIISWDEDEDVMLYGEHEVSQKLRQDRHAPVRTDWKLEASACHLGDVSLGSDGRSEGLRTGLDLSRNRSKIWQLLRFNKRRFEEMRHRILKYYKEYSPKGFMVGPQYWDEIQIELMVTVPAIWNQGARNMILNSATAAGFQNVRLYLEPHCAAALEMGMLMPRDGSRGYIDLNTIIAWFDIGHATNDWSAVRIRKPETEAAQPELQIAGAPTGGMAGSHVVHDLAWRHVLMSREVAAQGGLDEVLARLGGLNTEAEFRRQVNRKIEEEKKRPSPERFTLTVYGNEVWQDSEDPMERFDVEIFPEDVQSWLNEWADRLGEELERSLAETHSRLEKHGVDLRKSEETFPVAKGGLKQYPRNEPDPTPTGYFYLLRNEIFNQYRHPDAVEKWKKYGDATKAILRRALHQPGLRDDNQPGDVPQDEVVDRLTLLHQRPHGREAMSFCIPISFFLDTAEDFASLELPLYFSDRFFQDGKPLRDKYGNVRPGFRPFQLQFGHVEVDWRQWQSKVEMVSSNGRQLCHIQTLVRMLATDDNWQIHLTVLEPGQEVRYYRRNDDANMSGSTGLFDPVNTEVDYKILQEYTVELWDRYRTPFVIDDSNRDQPGEGLYAGHTKRRRRRRQDDSFAPKRRKKGIARVTARRPTRTVDQDSDNIIVSQPTPQRNGQAGPSRLGGLDNTPRGDRASARSIRAELAVQRLIS